MESSPDGRAEATSTAGRALGPDAFRSRAEALEWLLFDVDGVLTDGRLWYSAEGETLKAFDVRDRKSVV